MTVAELILQLMDAPQDKLVRVCSPKGEVAEAEIVSWMDVEGPDMEPGVRIEVGFGPCPFDEEGAKREA